MNKDIDAQFLCKDCERYNLCQYYERRKEDSYICKYFHLSAEPCEDTISMSVIDDIKTEINQLPSYVARFNGGDFAIHIDKEGVLQIINKHISGKESE